MSNYTKSSSNNYGEPQRRYTQHDERIQRNFTQDNEDYFPNGAQYNDRDEIIYNHEDRLSFDHHDRPERRRRFQDEEDYRPSNYSDGGHGRKFNDQTESRREGGSDNADYGMNKDFSRGAAERYSDSDERFVRRENREHPQRGGANYSPRGREGREDDHELYPGDNPRQERNFSSHLSPYQHIDFSMEDNQMNRLPHNHDEQSVPRDHRHRQSDWAPQDRYNEIRPDRHREASQDRYYPQLNSNPGRAFDYHAGTEDHEILDQEARRRGRHYREY